MTKIFNLQSIFAGILFYGLHSHRHSECNSSETDSLPFIHSFIHSFIQSGHFYSAPSSPLLLRGAPDYSTDTVSEFHAEAHRQLQVKDLPKVPTWRLERESDPPVESNLLNQYATMSNTKSMSHQINSHDIVSHQFT